MNKVGILPNLWFDREAEEAACFYTSVFEHSKLGRLTRYPGAGFETHGMPEGTVWDVDFELEGQRFVAFNAGPLFKFNPSVSFFVNFDPSRDKKARERIDALWEAFSAGGTVLMPLDSYPFSERYGWIQDKYGLSWQLILSDPEGDRRPPIFPSLMFVGGVAGRAEEAIDFYLSVFGNSKRGITARYGKGQEPDREGTIMFADFMIKGQWLAAMDSAHEHRFSFNEATSLMVECQTQEKVDYYWSALASGGGEEGVCGWLKDRFGVSWQVTPTILAGMLADGDRDRVERVTNAFLKMKRINIAELQRAFDGQTAAGSARGAT